MAKAYVNKRDKFLWDNSFKPESTNEIPVPTVSDEGKAIVVNENGNYALGDVSTENEIVYFKIDAQGENLIDCTMSQIKAALDDSKTVCLIRINGTTKFILPLFVYVPLTGSVNYAEFTNCKPGTYISRRRVNYETVKLDFANNTITYTDESGYISQNYSTTEQVVGTWIDGKPLYEQIVSSGLSWPAQSSSSSSMAATLAIPNVKFITDLKVIPIPLVATNQHVQDGARNSSFDVTVGDINTNDTEVNMLVITRGNNISWLGASDVLFLLRYTKTTD